MPYKSLNYELLLTKSVLIGLYFKAISCLPMDHVLKHASPFCLFFSFNTKKKNAATPQRAMATQVESPCHSEFKR